MRELLEGPRLRFYLERNLLSHFLLNPTQVLRQPGRNTRFTSAVTSTLVRLPYV